MGIRSELVREKAEVAKPMAAEWTDRSRGIGSEEVKEAEAAKPLAAEKKDRSKGTRCSHL